MFSTELDRSRMLTQLETLVLTGESVPERQRKKCAELGVSFHRRSVYCPGFGYHRLDECQVHLSEKVSELLNGFRDPNINAFLRSLYDESASGR